jgi:hypothetical protein
MSIIRFYNVPTTSEYFLVGTACSVALTTGNYFMQTGYARGQGANGAFLNLENANLRYKINGSSPATNCGHLFVAGDYLSFEDVSMLYNFQALNASDVATAYLHVTYFYD